MIVKRRVTRQFVQLENAIVRDRRLKLDEHGMLHYLLSLPDDWEVNLRQIEKFWTIGPDKRKRIFRSLRKVGWVQLERLQAEDGNFIGARWIVGDEPGAETSDAALMDEEIEDNDEQLATTPATAAPERQNPDALASGNHATPLPSDGLTIGRENHPMEKPSALRINTTDEDRESTNTTAQLARDDDDGEPPARFGEILRMWPADNIVSAFACERIFAKFSDKQKRDARDGMKPYLADCRNKGQNRLCDLRTYLDERRWEKFVSRGSFGARFFAVKRGSPEAMRWRGWLERNQFEKVKLFDEQMVRSGAYTMPTQWPPAEGDRHHGTDPPGELSDQDADAFVKTT